MEIGFLTFLVVITVQGFAFSWLLKRFLESRGWKIYGPVQMWKTKKGLHVLDDIAKKYPRFWAAYGNFGIILAFGFLGGLYVFRKRRFWKALVLSAVASLFILSPLISGSLTIHSRVLTPSMAPAYLAYFTGYGISLAIVSLQSGVDTVAQMAQGKHVAAKAGPVIPGVNIKGSPFQNVPWYGWLVFPILLLVHEMSHGILARLRKIKVNSAGVLLMGLLPLGAFVEPDEKQLEKAKPEKTLPLFGAGSTANYLTAFSFFVLLFLFIHPIMDATGITQAYSHYLGNPTVVLSTNPDIPTGVRILDINGIKIQNVSDIHKITKRLGPGAVVNITTNKGVIHTKLNSNGMLGVYLSQDYENLPIGLSLLYHILNFLGLVVFFNYVVGLMNLLPILPLDGGLMFREFLAKVFKIDFKVSQWVTIGVSLVFGIGLLLNLAPLFVQ